MVRLNDAGPLGSEAGLVRALTECGCAEATIERCAELFRAGRTCDQVRLLEQERRTLMSRLHAAQRGVDRIDYVIRELEQAEAL